TITGGEYGINLETSKGEVTNNIISNTSNDGISLFNGANGIIKGNTITNATGNGINIENASGEFTDNTINTTKKAGIRVNKSTTKSYVTYNRITNCVTSGILVDNSILNVSENQIASCDFYGMYFGTAGTYELNHNSVNHVKE